MNEVALRDAMLDSLPAIVTRDQVERLEQFVLKAPQIDLKTTHVLSGGVYARTIFIPAGTVLTGATHRKDHVNVLQGDIVVTTDEGMKRLTGHHVLPTRAGMKRAGWALGDTWWTTLIRTDKTNLNEIEADICEEPERLQTRNPEIGCAPVVMLENDHVTRD